MDNATAIAPLVNTVVPTKTLPPSHASVAFVAAAPLSVEIAVPVLAVPIAETKELTPAVVPTNDNLPIKMSCEIFLFDCNIDVQTSSKLFIVLDNNSSFMLNFFMLF